jgi:hypothetical protein
VEVRGFVPDAQIEVFAGTTLVGTETGSDPWGQMIPIDPPLDTLGQPITAKQTWLGHTSDPSLEVFASAHTEAYPAGLPQPRFPYVPLHDCGVATLVADLPQGGEVEVRADDDGDVTVVGNAKGVNERHGLWISPAFHEGDDVTAISSICDDPSEESLPETVEAAPPVLPEPEVHEIYDQGQHLVLGKLVNGAKVTIKDGAGVVIGGGGAPAGLVRFGIDPPVAEGDPLTYVQELCGVESPTGTTTVQPCSDLPAPVVIGPQPGDTQVLLANVVTGAHVWIYASGDEVGDGGGSLIQLIRPLEAGETILAVQGFGDCVGASAYQVEVGTGLNDPTEPGLCQVEGFEYGADGSLTEDITDLFPSAHVEVTVPMNAVPLHGYVRHPTGPGRFPLVLVVHGNTYHPDEADADGYFYLLDRLASHCMIAVSVDEWFLNGVPVEGEMDARAYLLLRHLQLWREWDRDPTSPWFTKVDHENVGLSGHSRGGEAVAVAHNYNAWLHDPLDPRFDFGFGIRALYAIAPVDGQIVGAAPTSLSLPPEANQPMLLTDVDYYVMHGSHDADVSSFAGHRTYDRAFPVAQPVGYYKGLLWVYGANHVYWNSGWDPSYFIAPTGDLITRGEQEVLGQSFLTAMMLATLKGWHPYQLALAGDATFPSLPTGVTRVNQFQRPRARFLDHWEEDDVLTSGSMTGVSNSVAGTPAPHEQRSFDDHSDPTWTWEETEGLYYGWSDDRTELIVEVPLEVGALIPSHPYLAFRVGQVHDPDASHNPAGGEQDLTVFLAFGQDPSQTVQVSWFRTLPYPQIAAYSTGDGLTKTIMSTVRIPWARFVDEDPEADLSKLTAIHFKFDQRPTGLVVIDEIHLSK